MNLIWKRKEPLEKSLYTSSVIIQGSENINKDGMKDLSLPPTTKYEIMHWGVYARPVSYYW